MLALLQLVSLCRYNMSPISEAPLRLTGFEDTYILLNYTVKFVCAGTVCYWFVTLQQYSLHQYTLQRYSLHQYTLQRYSLHQYTSLHYSLHQYTSQYYSLHQYTPQHYSLHQYTRSITTCTSTPHSITPCTSTPRSITACTSTQTIPLPTVPRGTVPRDVREHQPARAVVEHWAGGHTRVYGLLANETSEELLRSQKISVKYIITTYVSINNIVLSP